LFVESAAQSCQQVDRFATGQGWPQCDIAGHVGHFTVQRDCIGPRIATEHPGLTRRGAQDPEQYTDGGGFSGTVRPEEAVDLAGVDGEIQPVQCVNVTEVFVKTVHFYDVVHVSSCPAQLSLIHRPVY